MTLTTLPRQVLRTQYRIVRRPWDLVEHRVAARLPVDAPVRLAFERWLGGVDAAVGRRLQDDQLRDAGEALRERAEELGQAGVLERSASRRMDRAQAHLVRTFEEADQERDEAREQARSAAEQALGAETEEKRQASARADERAQAGKDEAEAKARGRLKSVGAASRAAQERIDAREREQAGRAHAKLESAVEGHDSARDKEARAERLGELANAEREERRTRRSTG